MKSSDPTIRRVLLKPLVRRRTSPAKQAKLDRAFQVLEERAIASEMLPEYMSAQKQACASDPKNHWKNPEIAKLRIEFAAAMYLARKLSFQEYTFMVAHVAEGVHDARLQDGAYPELTALSESMRKIERAHGLSSDQYWPTSDAPPDFLAVNAQWDNTETDRFSRTLKELEGQSVTDLFHKDRDEYDRLRERGRRSFFHKSEFKHALIDTIKRYEREAMASAEAGAFTAAITLLGAAGEGLLLLRCLRSRKKASEVAAALPSKRRPHKIDEPATWSFDNLIRVCLAAGWLPAIKTTTLAVRPDGLADLLRHLRNCIHPGKVCTVRPWIEAEERDFEDTEIIYTTLFSTVFNGALLKQYSDSSRAV
ncbi:MAG: hypothetical protein ACREPY_02275 [Rhodanobacteraceae bacterium]